MPLRVRLLAVLPMINVITGWSSRPSAGADSLGVAVLAAIGVATTISLELTILLSRSILRRSPTCSGRPTKVAEGDFDAAVPVTTADEIGELAASFNGMVTGLRERERIREAFGTYLDEEVAEYILSDGFYEGGEVGRRLDPLLRRQGLLQLRRLGARPRGRRLPEHAVRGRRPDRSPPRAATSTSSRATG